MNKKLLVGIVALGCGGLLVGNKASAGDAKKAAGGMVKEENCGAMMKSLVPLPTKFAELMTAVSEGQMAHANWVGMGKDKASQAEAVALKKIAEDHHQMATDAKKAAMDMEAASTLAPAPHDHSKMDPKMMTESMTKQIKLEREMAAMMMKHADESEKKLMEMNKATTTAH